jgi:hypothetical protein
MAALGRHLKIDLDEKYAHFPQPRDRDRPLPDELPPPLHEACEVMMSRLLKASVLA